MISRSFLSSDLGFDSKIFLVVVQFLVFGSRLQTAC